MKKAITIMLCLIMLASCVLPCSALDYMTCARYTYLGYVTLVSSVEEPDHFVHYKQLKEIGDFIKFYGGVDLRWYTYTLRDPAGYQLKMSADHIWDIFGPPDAPEAEYILSDLAVSGDMRWLLSDAVDPTAGDGKGRVHGVLTHAGIQYHYYDAQLYKISWIWNDILFSLYSVDEDEDICCTESYPVDEAETIMARFLQSDTAEGALEEMISRLERVLMNRRFNSPRF